MFILKINWQNVAEQILGEVVDLILPFCAVCVRMWQWRSC